MPNVSILVITHLGIGSRSHVETVRHRFKALGYLQGLFKPSVLRGMIVIDCLAKLIIMTEGLFHLFTLSVGLVEVVFRIVRVSINNTDITPGRQPMLHDDARLGQCLIGTLQHLIQLLGIHI